VTTRPVNSIILILDKASGSIPTALTRGSVVTATESCVVACTLCAPDGPTTVTLSDHRESIGDGLRLAYRGTLATPNSEMHVCTAALDCIATAKVGSQQTTIEVWVNRDREPDDICILFDVATSPSGSSA